MFLLEQVRFGQILQVDYLKIEANRIVAVLGESGSGKTTLLRLLNHLITPDQGLVSYRGEDLKALDPVALRRRVVMLPQNPPVFPGSIRENLLVGLRLSESPLCEDDRLLLVLDQVSLDKTLDDLPERLSGGEKQRLALARVFLMEPEVLLLDEPSSSLDRDTEEAVVGRLAHSVRESGKTLVMVTHSRLMAERYADQIVEMKNGMVLREERTQ